MNAALLEVADLSVAYGQVAAVVSARLSVGQGQIVTVIGPNGAGKTTLLSAIIGSLPANGSARGTIRFDRDAVNAAEVSIERMVASGMTLVPERRELFGEMSVADNLLLGAFQRYRSGQRDHAANDRRSLRAVSRACAIGERSWPALCPAENARCLPSGAR